MNWGRILGDSAGIDANSIYFIQVEVQQPEETQAQTGNLKIRKVEIF